MLRPRAALCVTLLFLTLAACDSGNGELQRLFEDGAFLSAPSGYTERGPTGTLGELDSDDWRIGPYFAGRAQLTQIPFPNPTQGGDAVTLQLSTDGLTGLSLYRLRSNGDLSRMQVDPGSAGPTFVTFTFFGSEVADIGQPGLYRLFVLDGFQRVVTYGDVLLR